MLLKKAKQDDRTVPLSDQKNKRMGAISGLLNSTFLFSIKGKKYWG